MVRLGGQGLKSGASRLALAVALALVVPAAVLTQPAAAQVQIGTSFDCARAGTGQSIPSLVCQTPALQLVDLHQMQAYYTLRHAQPERLQELRNQFTARIQGLVRECSTEQVRASGSQPACVEQALREMRNLWVQQIQQTGNAAALEEIRLNSARFWEGQQALRAGGFVQPDSAIDGIYGTGTRQAITRFQTERGMQAHGFLTSATADALRGLFPGGGAAASSGAQQQSTAVPPQIAQVPPTQRTQVNPPSNPQQTSPGSATPQRPGERATQTLLVDGVGSTTESAVQNAAEEARRAAADELRRVTALRQELEAELQAAREAQAAMRQPPTPGAAPPHAGASALAEARAAPTPFSDDFGAVNSAVGCLSSEPAASRVAIFRERYEGKEFAWTGRVRAFFPSLIELDMGTGRTNLVISLVSGQEGLPVNPGQTVSIRFTMTQLGTCSVAFRGQRGVILSIDGTSLR
jgi:uncharacterized protein